VTLLLLVGFVVLFVFLLGFLAGHGVETRISMTRGKRQAVMQHKLNEMCRALHEQEANESRHVTFARPFAPYAYIVDHEEINSRS